MYWEHISKQKWEKGDVADNKELLERKKENPKHPCIYVDMDGTLAVWNHEKSKEYPDGVTMEMVNAPGYFRGLKPNEEIVQFTEILFKKGYDIRILSKSNFHAIREKEEWLQEYLPFISKENIFFVPLNAEKSDFVPHIKSNDILIDDYNVNLQSWRGIPIKCVTDRNTVNPNFAWIDYKSPVYKNMDTITWVLIKEWQMSQFTKDMQGSIDLKYIFDRSTMSLYDFTALCNRDFNIDLSEDKFRRLDFKDALEFNMEQSKMLINEDSGIDIDL